MKKLAFRTILLALVMVLTLSFSACGSSSFGNDGESAYEIWLAQGHSGSKDDFLNWLKGEDGKDGEDGDTGEDGLSAYQIWLDSGNQGTEADFLDWLRQGKQGEDGLSAYDIWLEQGHEGSIADFLSWIEGGSDGLSAYELFKQNNPSYAGSEEQWLDDLANGKFARYTVTFEANGGTALAPMTDLVKGCLISSPAATYKDGYIFDGWFKDRDLNFRWDFNSDVVQNDTTLYAKWIKDGFFTFTPIAGTSNCAIDVISYPDEIDYIETLIIPSKASIGGVEYTVTEVAYASFVWFSNLKVIILPETIAKIDDYAFAGSESLKTIYMPNVESIGANAFAYCGKLENIFLPASLTDLGINVFRYYNSERNYPLNIHFAGDEASASGWISSLGVGSDVNIFYNSSYTSFDELKFQSVSSGSCSVSIADSARNSIEKLFIPPVWQGRLVTQVSEFSDCINLKEVVLPATVSTIGASAFFNCNNLEKINLSDVVQIRSNALALNPKIETLVIPSSVSTIQEGFLAVSGQQRDTDLTIYVDYEFDTVQTLSWSEDWLKNAGSNVSVVYGWLTPARVTFDSLGGSENFVRSVKKGRKISSNYSYKDNYTLVGWFKDEQLTEPWDFENDVVTEDITLYAAWTEGEAATEGLAFYPINSNEYMVSRGTADLNGRLVIPSEHEGKPVTAIESRAFANMSVLDLVSNITSVNIPDTITDLGAQSFGGTAITSVRIPAGVTEIGSAFHGCSRLVSIDVSAANESLYVEDNCVIRKSDNVLIFGCKSSIIPDGVKGIGENAFSGSEITKVEIPHSVEFIDSDAFAQCLFLTTVIIPDSVQAIGEMAFFNCIRLKYINIPYGVTMIKANTFAYCYELRSITIPNSVKSIEWFAFSETGLTSVVIPDSVTRIDSGAFEYCKSLVSIYIPDTVTDLKCGFSGCSSLISVRLPRGIESLPINAFSRCTSLESIELPEGLKSIPPSAFVHSTALKSVVIPSSVNYIGNSAFTGCTNLSTFFYGGQSVGEWNAIEKDWVGSEFTGAQVYLYSETQPTSSGNYWRYAPDKTPTKW